MNSVPLYPMLAKENKILGLEFMDLLILILFYLVLFLVSRNLIVNVILLGLVYLFLRRYKKNKPPRYTETLIRFLVQPQKYTQVREIRL